MSTPTTRALSRLLPAVYLLVLPCLLLWRVVFHHEVFVPADLLRDLAPWRVPAAAPPVPWNPLMWDGVAEFYPWRLFAAQSLRQGALPLWNPHQFCGTPFVANSQSAVFYPPNLLFALLPVPTAFGVSALFHLALTGLLCYGFLRSPALGLRRAAALLGAIVWQLSTWQAAWLALPTFLCVSAWLPLALLLTDRLTTRPTLARGTGLGICLGLMLLAGHLQIALYALLLTLAYGLFRAVPRVREGHIGVSRLLFSSLLAAALMVALAAPQLLPAIELSRLSHRAGGAVTLSSYTGYTRLAMPALNLLTLFLPTFFGTPGQGTYWGIDTNGGPSAFIENACYLGVLALLLVLVGAALTWRERPTTRFFALAALLALLLALGTPLNALLFFGIPGFAQSGSPARVLVLWTFAGAVLAAIGADALRRHLDALRRLLWPLGAFLLLFALSLGGTVLWVDRNAPAGTLGSNVGHGGDLWRVPLGILLGAVALCYLCRRGTIPQGVFGGLLAALSAIDLLAVNGGIPKSALARDVYPVTPAITYLQQHTGEGRVMPINRRWRLSEPPPAVLPPNAATVYGLSDLQGYDSLLTGQYIHWAAVLDGGPPAPPENGNMVFTYGVESPQAREAAARYVVSRGPIAAGGPLRLAIQDRETFIYEDTAAQPRAHRSTDDHPIYVEDLTPTRLRLSIPSAGLAGSVVVADQWYPGWRAMVNGEEVPMRKEPEIFRTVEWAQRQVQTGTGQVHVEMRYLPTSFRLGLYGLCLALIFIGAVCAYGGTRLGRRGGRGG